MAEPWGVDIEVDLYNRFAGVPHLDWYRKIYAFLSNEEKVSARLEQLAADANAASAVSFMRHLAQIEGENGFSTEVVWFRELQDGGLFETTIVARRPFLDLGIDQRHGALTHRIQWAMIAMNLSSALPSPLKVADLYAGLTHSTPRIPPDLPIPGDVGQLSLWNVVVDAPYLEVRPKMKRVRNARSPEYLMTYMRDHPSAAVKQMGEFSRILAHVFDHEQKIRLKLS